MESEKKAKRLVLYRLNEVRRLVDGLLKGKGDLQPQRDPIVGDYIFGVEGLSTSKASALLGELESDGVLAKYRLDTVPTCPTCDHRRRRRQEKIIIVRDLLVYRSIFRVCCHLGLQ